MPVQGVENILSAVEVEFDVSRDDLMSPTRSSRNVALARQTAMARVRVAFPGESLSGIGRLFGRDRTTVRHACRKLHATSPV